MANDVAGRILTLARDAHAADVAAGRRALEADKADCLARTRTRLRLYVTKHHVQHMNVLAHAFTDDVILTFAFDGHGRVHFRRKGDRSDISVAAELFTAFVLEEFVRDAMNTWSSSLVCTRCSAYLARAGATSGGGTAWRRLLHQRWEAAGPGGDLGDPAGSGNAGHASGGAAAADAPPPRALSRAVVQDCVLRLVEAARDMQLVDPSPSRHSVPSAYSAAVSMPQ